MTVVDMEQWREEHDGSDALTCRCGSMWFELEGGAVTLNAERSVVGYAGVLICRECGTPN